MPLADRFAEYVAELHEISDSHRLPHGHPEDLSRLLEALQSSPDFAADFGSLMRSIVLREHFRPSEKDLVTLVAVAWAGAEPDDSSPQLSHLVQELRAILTKLLAQRALAHRIDAPVTISAESSEEEKRHDAAQDSVAIQPDAPAQNGQPTTSREASQPPEQPPSRPNRPSHQAPKSSVTGKQEKEDKKDKKDKEDKTEKDDKKDNSRTLNSLSTYGSAKGTPSETLQTRRFDPSAAEVLAMGLTGLVVALLFNVGSLPVYRSRVSVYLPSTIASTTEPRSGSQDLSLLNGELKEKVAERLLASSHPNPILRQDVLSRGMRDLHLGGSEPILYADLVAETARQVKVTHLEPQNLYELTCDSWDAQFAATFCNEMTNSLDDQPSDAISSQESAGPARTIDAALSPGSQVYPHWYLQGSAGLAVGCLLGVLTGFVRRPASKPVQEIDPRT
jgi:outer membrane biosynthesis protein TonB